MDKVRGNKSFQRMMILAGLLLLFMIEVLVTAGVVLKYNSVLENAVSFQLVRVGRKDLPLNQATQEDFVLVATTRDGKQVIVNNAIKNFKNDGDSITITCKGVSKDSSKVLTYTNDNNVDQDLLSDKDKPDKPKDSGDVELVEDDKLEEDADKLPEEGAGGNTGGDIDTDIGSDTELPDSITGKGSIISMVVTKPQNKVNYFSGERFDATGLCIDVNLSDGSVKKLQNLDLSSIEIQQGDTYVKVSHTHNGSVGHVKVPVSVIERTPTSITVLTQPKKTKYIEGEKFDPTGMRVLIKFGEGPDRELGFRYQLSGLIVNQMTVPITYTENKVEVKTEVMVEVRARELMSVQIKEKPKKTTYVENTTFEDDGLLLVAMYNNQLSEEFYDYKITDRAIKATTTEVLVTCSENGKSIDVKIPVKVSTRKVDAMLVTGTPRTMIQGLPFNPKGLRAYALFDNNEKEEIKDYTYDKKPLTVEDKSVALKAVVDEKELSKDVQIKVSEKNLLGIDVVTPPMQSDYIEDEDFNYDGLKVKAIYSNGDEKVVTVTAPKPIELGDTEVLLNFTEDGKIVTTTVGITVQKMTPTSIRIEQAPEKLKYIEEEPFKQDKMVTRVFFNNGKDYIKTPDVESKPWVYFNEKDAQGQSSKVQHEVKYTDPAGMGSVVVNQEITVVKKKPVSLYCEKEPTFKGTYTEGNKFLDTGLRMKFKADNGFDYYVVSKEVNQREEEDSGVLTCTDAGKDKLVYNQPTVAYKYELNGTEVAFAVPVKVVHKITQKIEVTKNPDNMTPIEDLPFNRTGMVVKATFDNGDVEEVQDLCKYTAGDLPKGDSVPITITYKKEWEEVADTKQTTLRLKVLAMTPTSIRIEQAPSRVTYPEEMVFDKTGMVVKGMYNNGKEYLVTQYGYPTAEMPYNAGKGYDARITYSENGATVPPIVQHISITLKQPVKFEIVSEPTDYQIEEIKFKPAGMTFKTTYDNHKSITVSQSDARISDTAKDVVLSKGKVSKQWTFTENAGSSSTVAKEYQVYTKLMKRLDITGNFKKEYIEEEAFEKAGLTATLVYDNGKTKDVTNSVEYSTTPLVAETPSLTFTYKENETQHDESIVTNKPITGTAGITVLFAIPNSISITTRPSKTTYNGGQVFRPEGMVVTGYFGSTNKPREIPLSRSGVVSGTADRNSYIYPNQRLTQNQSNVQLTVKDNKNGIKYLNCPVTVYAQRSNYTRYSVDKNLSDSGEVAYSSPNNLEWAGSLVHGPQYAQAVHVYGDYRKWNNPWEWHEYQGCYVWDGKETGEGYLNGNSEYVMNLRQYAWTSWDVTSGSNVVKWEDGYYTKDIPRTSRMSNLIYGAWQGTTQISRVPNGPLAYEIGWKKGYYIRKTRDIYCNEIRGNYIDTVEVSKGARPDNGKHSDGYWYVFSQDISEPLEGNKGRSAFVQKPRELPSKIPDTTGKWWPVYIPAEITRMGTDVKQDTKVGWSFPRGADSWDDLIVKMYPKPKNSINRASIKDRGVDRIYKQGDRFDPTGITVELKRDDGTTTVTDDIIFERESTSKTPIKQEPPMIQDMQKWITLYARVDGMEIPVTYGIYSGKDCTTCQGTGVQQEKCMLCQGTGKHEAEKCSLGLSCDICKAATGVCPQCAGSGKGLIIKCKDCQGTGKEQR